MSASLFPDTTEQSTKASTYQVLYRTYRPQVFDDFIGQDHIVSVLRSSLEKKHIGHAYLFHGSRGTGKTTLARIFARELGCAPEDIYEIDGASHRKIEDIRDLRENVATLPFNSLYKVYLIDEVHMLTKEAFNALLKTLEEPPRHVIFMLATTEYDKLPDTIISRCQVFTLRRPSPEILSKLVERVASKESLQLSSGARDLIALLGDGSFRDTLGILEKVHTLSADALLSESEVERVTGAPSLTLIRSILEGVIAHDLSLVLHTLDNLMEQGIVPQLLVRRLIMIVRSVLRARFQPALNTLPEGVSVAEKDIVNAYKGKEGARINSDFLKLLLSLDDEVSRASIPIVPLELAFMQFLGNNSEVGK